MWTDSSGGCVGLGGQGWGGFARRHSSASEDLPRVQAFLGPAAEGGCMGTALYSDCRIDLLIYLLNSLQCSKSYSFCSFCHVLFVFHSGSSDVYSWTACVPTAEGYLATEGTHMELLSKP